MKSINLTINGKKISKEVEDYTLLSTFIRENLNLTGTHIGCDTSQCGACVIHVDGDSIKSCTVLAAQVNGKDLTTVEGLASEGQLHPIQKSFQNNHALQCGFCTPGFVMSMYGLFLKTKKPNRAQILNSIQGNLCRCTGYGPIISAAEDLSKSFSCSNDFLIKNNKKWAQKLTYLIEINLQDS